MQDFAAIHALAANRKGGPRALEKLLSKPESRTALRRVPDHRWLSGMAKSIFQAGFVWRVVEHKWPDFEQVFQGFDPHVVAHLPDEAIEEMLGDTRVIRHRTKLLAVRANAVFVLELAALHGSAAAYFADFPSESYCDLLAVLKKDGARLGGTSAQYFLRRMGRDSFVLSRDVVAALKRERIVDRQPNSKRDLQAVQSAFNHWREQSGRSLTELSQILAMGIES